MRDIVITTDLVQKLCLYEVADVVRGERVTKAVLKDSGKFPVISGGIKPLGYFDKSNRDENTITIAQYGTAGYIDWQTQSFWANDVCYSVFPKEQVINKYLYYALKNQQQYIYSLKTNAIPSHLPLDSLKNVLLYIPPLQVQQEIVKILDNFTMLEAELEAELEARKKQYELIRDTLIWESSQNIMSLKEISVTMYRGQGIKRDEVTNEGIPCVRYGEIYTKYGVWFDKCESHTTENFINNKKYFEHGDILFAITGESVNEISKSTVYLGNDKCLAGGDIVVMKHNQDPKYLSFALSTTVAQKQKSEGKVKSKVVHSNIPSLETIRIPIPDLALQREIGEKLDSFNTLINNLTHGLPAEIAARRKQYEYYRNKLLTFKEVKHESV